MVSAIAKCLPNALSLFWTAKLAGAQLTVDRLEPSGGESMRQPRSRMAAAARLDADTTLPLVGPGAVPAIRAVVVLKTATKPFSLEEAGAMRTSVYGGTELAAGVNAIMARPMSSASHFDASLRLLWGDYLMNPDAVQLEAAARGVAVGSSIAVLLCAGGRGHGVNLPSRAAR